MAIGSGRGENRAQQAAEEAIHSQLLDISIDGARGILFNVTGGVDMSLFEVNEAAEIIRRTAHPDANIIFGAVIDPNLSDELRITVIATGFESMQSQQQPTTSSKTIDFPTRSYDTEDLDIPAFLRRARSRKQ